MAVTFFGTVKSFASFLAKWVASGGHTVDQNTANLRAEICVHCHNNLPSSEAKKGCSTCGKMGKSAMDIMRSTIIGAKATTSDISLLTCNICGCDLKIKVWIPSSILYSKDDANAFPSFCWIKKINEGTDL